MVWARLSRVLLVPPPLSSFPHPLSPSGSRSVPGHGGVRFLILTFLASTVFAQVPAPIIETITPTSAPTSGGTTVTVTGRNLHAPPICGVQPGSCTDNVISIGFFSLQMIEATPTRLVGITPPRPAGIYDLTVHRADGATATSPNAFTVGGLGYDRVLIPVGATQGGFGSRWESALVAFNSSDHSVRIDQDPSDCCCAIPEGCQDVAAPHSALSPLGFSRIQGGGFFLYLLQPYSNDVHFNLRVRDSTRQSESFGTEIPVVRAQDIFAFPEEVSLLNVPTDSRFRVTLRVYNFDGESTIYGSPQAIPFYVQVFPMNGNERLANTFVTLSHNEGSPDFPRFPGYAQLDFSSTFPELRDRGLVRVLIGAAGYFVRYWTFITVTNNETQHVTTITPQ